MIKIINNILIYIPNIYSYLIYRALFNNTKNTPSCKIPVFGKRAARKGQATVEYLLMLATIVAMVLIFFFRFHKEMLGGFFSIVGGILGAATPE